MERNYRDLLIAILVQAVRDYQDPNHHKSAQIFLDSPEFAWLWGHLSEDMIHWPALEVARKMIGSGDITVKHKGYH